MMPKANSSKVSNSSVKISKKKEILIVNDCSNDQKNINKTVKINLIPQITKKKISYNQTKQ